MRALAALVGCLCLTSCFTTAADFQKEAESFIAEDDGIADALEVAIASATCDEPPDREIGRTFRCQALDTDGGSHSFVVEITGDTSFEVTIDPFEN
jgi:hypothetical protein